MRVPDAHDVAFRPAADRAREMRPRRGFVSARHDEIPRRRPRGVQPRDLARQRRNGVRAQRRPARREFAADPQQIALRGFDERRLRRGGQRDFQQAQRRAEFVQRAQRLQPRVGFRNARAAGQNGEAVVVHVRIIAE
ncbi:MAG TPA: hypothetical protein PK388_07750, partial [Kiritimatiellia bacterium]|nr:hypothetical protein [Kiritimatiellia bacterium]